MMKYNNLYNFKNTIRHFVNIDAMDIPSNIADYDLKKLAWTSPFKYRVKKTDNSFRTLKIPNVLVFAAACEKMKDLCCFYNPTKLDIKHKRLVVNVKAGEFEIGTFEKELKKDFEKLCIYDSLLRLDIKEFYGRVYTHLLGMGEKERYLTNLNTGATNGLIMGNYLSLYWAEKQLSDISRDLQEEIISNSIECEFNYFSDDFYFFCNEESQDEIIKCFDRILDKYDLERNKDKKECWDYFTYNNYNVVEKYWKKIIAVCNQTRQREDKKRLVFLNQLIYRASQLADDKLRKILINGFFRTKYFRKDIDLRKYEFRDYDIHQLCFLFKTSPECLLYSADRLIDIANFDENKFRCFFEVRYRESLKRDFHEEQLYYYYSMKLWGFNDILQMYSENVVKSNNQVLISYYLMSGWLSTEQITKLKSNTSEEAWFVNYHLILTCKELYNDLENSINNYLIPKKTNNDTQKNSFKNFYMKNLLNRNSMIVAVEDVCETIHEYLDIRFEEAQVLSGF